MMEITNIVVVAVGFCGLIAVLVLYLLDPLKRKLMNHTSMREACIVDAVTKILNQPVDCPECGGYVGKFTGSYHCSNCGKTFRIDEQAKFLAHQKTCDYICPTCKGTGKVNLLDLIEKEVER